MTTLILLKLQKMSMINSATPPSDLGYALIMFSWSDSDVAYSLYYYYTYTKHTSYFNRVGIYTILPDFSRTCPDTRQMYPVSAEGKCDTDATYQGKHGKRRVMLYLFLFIQ